MINHTISDVLNSLTTLHLLLLLDCLLQGFNWSISLNVKLKPVLGLSRFFWNDKNMNLPHTHKFSSYLAVFTSSCIDHPA